MPKAWNHTSKFVCRYLNKTRLLKEKTDIYWRSKDHSCCPQVCHPNFGKKLCFLPTTRFFTSILPTVFECSTFIHNHQPHCSKLDPKSIKCIFLGYSPHQKECYSPSTRKFYHTMDVIFFENQPYYPKVSIQGKKNNSTRRIPTFGNWRDGDNQD